ncbi:MAG: phosphoribosylamine--glycine ligase [Alphaproteobacteria bacterium]|nr:phosphoribosylamine--glycine ligase [Alphaproteobacteria bacterium]
MNVLLIGSGGREHALGWALAKSVKVAKIFCAPGNAGIAEVATCLTLDVSDHAAVAKFCAEEEIGLVVVGPEAPLVDGLVDSLHADGIRAFGPSKAAAALEGSKGFTKDLCQAQGIPTAGYVRCSDLATAQAAIDTRGVPIVIKADGLAAGKGVVIAQTRDQANAAIAACFEGAFGGAGAEVVIEDFLQGEEASFFVLVDGEHILPLATAQDHKRVGDGDTGPNTGGMGAYSPAPVMTDELVQRTLDEIITPTVKGMAERGMPYQGVLYAGLMITDKGPELIEYNVRFGDPECQVLMARLQSDLAELLIATCDGNLDAVKAQWDDASALCVVMAADGYPGAAKKGSVISGLLAAGQSAGVTIFHAGTKQNGDHIVANGGRVLGITAVGATVKQAQSRAYAAVSKIDWPDGFCRSDIGWRAVAREEDLA